MVKIVASLPAPRIEAVLGVLDRMGVVGYTLIEAQSTHALADGYRTYRGTRGGTQDATLEIVLGDTEAADVVEAIVDTAELEEGTDRIVVTPVLDAIRIRTEERGESAIR